ncbi:MAG: transglycosylase SLT domain-containing protein [Pseudomonadota bacterium]
MFSISRYLHRMQHSVVSWCVYVCLLLLIVGPSRAAEVEPLRIAQIANHAEIHIHRDNKLEQRMLTDAAAGIGRNIEWVTFNTPFELRESLLDKTADIYLSPLPLVTDEKLQDAEIASLAPIGFERYRVVGRTADFLSGPDDLDKKRVAVKFSSPALPFLRQLKSDGRQISIVVLPDQMSRNTILSKVEQGIFDVAIIATNFRSQSVENLPTLKFHFDITSLHPVSWKVHADKTVLIGQINKFLQRYHASYIEDSVQKSLLNDGIVRAIAERGNNYSVSDGQPGGLEYELIKRFADHYKLRLDIVVAKNAEQAKLWLENGFGDIILSHLIVNGGERSSDFALTHEYGHAIPVVISHRDKVISAQEQLRGKHLAIAENSSHNKFINGLDPSVGITRLSAQDAENGQIIQYLRAGKYHGFVTDARFVPDLLRENPDLRAGLSLPVTQGYRWAVREDNPELHTAVNDFFKRQYQSADFRQLTQKRTKPQNTEGDRISPFDTLIKTYAERYDFDWRLIAAQMYQESRFDPDATSRAGARGLMQIMPATASELGLANPEAPEASIHAGIKYLDGLRDRFEDAVPQNERLWMALAAYNAGFERVKRARKLAQSMGLNPNRWFDNVEVAMRKMTQPDSPVQGCKCGQAIVYVRSIRSLYSAYRFVGTA